MTDVKKIIIRVLVIVFLIGAGWGGYAFFKQLPQRQQEVATTKVRQGDVIVRTYTRGELRATRSATLTAPNLFGTVQVTRLAPLGAFARDKDLIVEFDDSEVNSRLEEKQLELEQIDEQIKKSEADLAVRNNQDQVDLLTARYGVRRAELEVRRNELLAAIDAKKNLLSLEEAKHRLQQLESDIKSRQDQAKAELAVLHEKKNKGLLEMSREKSRLSQVKLLAPISGLVAIKQMRPNFFFPGMQIPDIREGDQVNPGNPVADILDLSELELLARVGELDRANLREGQNVLIRLDAIPGKTLDGKIKSMSGTATANVFSGDPAKRFDVVFSIDMKQLFATLGVKPEQVQKILAMAELNRNKPVASMPPPAPVGQGSRLVQRNGNSGPQANIPAGSANATIIPQGNAPPSGPSGGGGQRMMILAGPPGGGPPGPGGPQMMGLAGAKQFSEKDLENAKLPPPPEEDSQFEVLLRPGLLADVEIIVDKIPNAIHIPTQAVFEKDGKLVAFVKNGNRFEERFFTPLKRSESTMVIAKGLQPGELVALSDPTAKKDSKEKKNKSGGAMGALPGGGGK